MGRRKGLKTIKCMGWNTRPRSRTVGIRWFQNLQGRVEEEDPAACIVCHVVLRVVVATLRCGGKLAILLMKDDSAVDDVDSLVLYKAQTL